MRFSTVFALLTVAALPGPVGAQEASTPIEKASLYFPDVPLLTQNGDSVRLFSDLLKDKVVVINAFFESCHGACPKMAGVLAGLQSRLGDRIGNEVLLLSFSVDPETDTPEKLKAYAEKFEARPGWLFLTGPKERMDLALSKLGLQTDVKENHLTIFVVLNLRTGLLMKTRTPDITAESLQRIVESALHDGG